MGVLFKDQMVEVTIAGILRFEELNGKGLGDIESHSC